jgi:sterol-4alpha-carboxylate 3-dehydrogenase (decarboxylating)
MDKSNVKVLVTGGSGFLGQAIVRELLEPNAPVKASMIRIYDMKEPGNKHSDSRIEFIKGDVRNTELLDTACKGINLVIHAAAIIDWGIYTEEEVMSNNLTGTRNVIEACMQNNVGHLVFTSSLDAIYNGKPLVNVDESHPYPVKHRTSYCRSKYLAELAVKEANSESLKTVILRPSDIFGEADPYHIDSLVNMAKGGFYVRIGNGKARTQHVYVGNIAYAHLLAGSALMNGSDHIGGEVYFITDGAGTNFFKFFDKIVEGIGYTIKPKNFWIPRPIAYVIASITEFSAWIIRPFKFYVPKFSRFAVTYTCTEYTYTSDKAKKDFGFIPKYSEQEALERTIEYYKRMKVEN